MKKATIIEIDATKTYALTEYHYGGRTEISGALSQADVLGIYGRYGVFAACIWGMSAKDTAQILWESSILTFLTSR